MILLKITLKLRMILQIISRRVVLSVLMNTSPSNVFPILLLAEIHSQKCQAIIGCYSQNWCSEHPGVLTLMQICKKPANCSIFPMAVLYSRKSFVTEWYRVFYYEIIFRNAIWPWNKYWFHKYCLLNKLGGRGWVKEIRRNGTQNRKEFS